MSILIKGMDMPNKCWDCELFEELAIHFTGITAPNTDMGWCRGCKKEILDVDYKENKPFWCPLVEVPNEQTNENKHFKIKDLTVDGISAFENEREQVIRIYWSANIGFGEYTLSAKNCKDWEGDSECMDKGDDKEFLKMLLEKVVEMVEVTG